MAQTKAQLLGPVVGDVTIDTNTLSLDSENNKVGIGTASATNKLHVKDTFNTAYSLANVADEANHILKLENASTTANAFSGMQFRVGSGADLFFGAIQQTVNHGDFFFANQNSPQKEMMRIKSTGNVGIGEDNPNHLLHVNISSDSGTNTTTSYNTASMLRLDGTGGANHLAGIGFGYRNGGGEATPALSSAFIGIKVSSWTGYVKHDLVFATRDATTNIEPTERLRIKSDGDVSLTQNLLIPEDKKIHLEGASSDDLNAIWKADTENTVFVTSRYNIANIIDSNNDDAASFWSVRHNSTTLAGSGELMRVQSDGKVGIGTLTPADKLSIGAAPNSLVFGAKDTTRDNHIFQLLADDAPGNGELRLYKNSASGTHEKTVQIQSSGDSYFTGGAVGIGVDDPSSHCGLHIIGSSYWPILVKTTSVGGGGVAIKNKDDVTSLYTGSGGSAWLTGSVITDGLIRAQNNLIFATNGNNERLRITSSGQLQHSAGSGDNQFISKRINTTSSAGDYFLHVRAQNNTPVDVGFLGFHRDTANDDARFVVGTRNTGGSVTEKLRITSDGKIGVGNDNPTVQLDVKRATAGTIAKFYDTGSNGGALYNGGPILGLSRISNGSVSVDGLLFQVGIDNSNSSTYNIDETVFCVGNRGVGIGEDDPQVNLHLSKSLGTTSSYKDAQMIRIAGTSNANQMAGIGFSYYTTNPSTSAYPSVWIGAKVSSWTAYVKHDLVFATRGTDTNVEPTERFRITEGGELQQNYDLRYRQQGYFTTATSAHNNTNSPTLATTLSYSFGYQDGFSSSNGTWAFPYPKLIVGYHTGINFGGHRNYYGCRFFEDHPSNNSNIVLSVGNQSTGVHVTNTLTAGTKTFRIVHPHPSKKYTHDLVHSVIEGPQCDNIYRGKVDLVNGTASINIDTVSNMTDGTFVLLNRDIQCFTSNETGWTAVKGSVSGNILTITAKSSSCTDTISWMVIGERQDDKIKSPEIEITDSDGKLIIEPLTIEQTHM